MRPKDVDLSCPLPLTNVFGKCEAELAAALIIMPLAAADEDWRPVTYKEMREHLRVLPEDQRPAWLSNPFVQPNFMELIKRRYAEDCEPDGREFIRFTESGLAALRNSRWNLVRVPA